ncbi:MAG: UPF0164 family protein [bacterium]|nr:UPF0164 family protein [bacterium]
MSWIQNRHSLILLTVLFMLVSVAPVMASIAGGQCLQIPPGARANGLGQAYVALADDATAAWWNPAGLGFHTGRTLGMMHSQLVPDLADDIYYEYAAFVHQKDGWGTYAISLIYLSYGESAITSTSSTVEGYFNSYEFSPAISYGVKLDENTSLGMGLKYVRVDLAPDTATHDINRDGAGSSVAIDIGLMRRLGMFNIGAVLSNFGPNISFIDEEQSDPMPRHFKAGISAIPVVNEYGHLLATFDASKMLVDGGPFIANCGFEVQYTDVIALRMGYIYDQDGDIESFTFGGGVCVPLSNKDLFIDYASVPQASELDRVHRFSLELHF